MEQISYWAEGTKALSVEEAKQANQAGFFRPLSDHHPNFGQSNQRFWLRIDIQATQEETGILELSNAFLYDVQLYDGVPNKELYHTGINFPFAHRPINFRRFAFPLSLHAGKNVFYLVTHRRNEVLRFSLAIFTETAFQIHQTTDSLFFGPLFGIMVFIALFAAGLFIVLREPVHLWYCTYILLITLFIAADNGFGYQWLWSDLPLVQKYIRSFLALAAVVVQLRFMQHYLQQTKSNSRYAVWVQRTIIAALLLFVLLSTYVVADVCGLPTNGWPNLVVRTLAYTVLLSGVVLLLLSTGQKIRQGQTAAKVYLLAMLPLLLQTLLVLAARWSLVLVDIDTARFFALALLIEVITLGCGLLLRYHQLHTEKNNLSLQVLQHRQQLAQNVLLAQDAERKRIAEDLHDHLGGTLSAAKGLLSSLTMESVSPSQQKLSEAQTMLDEACNDLRFIAHGLMPTGFSNTTLAASLQELVRKANYNGKTAFVFLSEGEPAKLTKEVELTLFRIANELVQNVVRHAEATEAILQLLYFPDAVQVMIEDNGKGFDEANAAGGIGLKNVHSRSEYINASLRYEPSPWGTTVVCTLPYNPNTTSSPARHRGRSSSL